jgi:hypothetical protein
MKITQENINNAIALLDNIDVEVLVLGDVPLRGVTETIGMAIDELSGKSSRCPNCSSKGKISVPDHHTLRTPPTTVTENLNMKHNGKNTQPLERLETISFYTQSIAKTINLWLDDPMPVGANTASMQLNNGDIAMLTCLLVEFSEEQLRCVEQLGAIRDLSTTINGDHHDRM